MNKWSRNKVIAQSFLIYATPFLFVVLPFILVYVWEMNCYKIDLLLSKYLPWESFLFKGNTWNNLGYIHSTV